MAKKLNYADLKNKWYAKLKKSGFDDIEKSDEYLKKWSLKFSSSEMRDRHQASSEYYYMATQFLIDYKFKSNRERVIWEYHSNGLSIRNIVATLNKTKVIKTTRTAVHETLRNLVLEMKRMYVTGFKEQSE